MPQRFHGLIAAAHTPMHPDGRINTSVIAHQADLFVETGLSGVFVCGTSGESHSLTVEERISVTEAWVEAAQDRLAVLVHVGHNSIPEARRLAAHAREAGVAAVSAMAPSFFRPRNVDALIDCCAAVAEAAGDTPFYYYHLPALTGVSVSMVEFLERGVERIPTLTGVKYTEPTLHEFQACLELDGGRFDMLFGCDEMLLGAWEIGARGAVGSTYNYAAPLYHRLIQAFEKGDLETARAQQAMSLELVQVLLDLGVLPTGKAIMSMIGVECGPVRLPLRPLCKQERQSAFQRVQHLDIFSRPLCRPQDSLGGTCSADAKQQPAQT